MARNYTIRGFNTETGRQVIQYDDNGEWAELGESKEAAEQKVVDPENLENKVLKPASRKRK